MKWLFWLLLVAGTSFTGRAQPSVASLLAQPSINTAAGEDYLSDEEKKIFAYLNLARAYPQLFADSVLKPYQGAKGLDNSYLKTSSYVTSLRQQLQTMKPMPPLLPNKSLYVTALCFARATGASGATGHDRKGTACPAHQPECCSYGLNTALDIVLQLLIDKDVASLGHRKICLGPYRTMGLSLQPHKTYRHTAVLQFK